MNGNMIGHIFPASLIIIFIFFFQDIKTNPVNNFNHPSHVVNRSMPSTSTRHHTETGGAAMSNRRSWRSRSFCILLAVLVAIIALLFSSSLIGQHDVLPLQKDSRVLLITAHPDDETMFFGPTILHIIKRKFPLTVLSITGNSIRRSELIGALGVFAVPPENITFLNVELFPDGFVTWDTDRLGSEILKHIDHFNANVLITFDGGGVR
jgi:hypothetical protein